MTDRPPEGPKADFGPEDATTQPIPAPPSRAELDRISEDQALITDEWADEPPEKERGPKT